MLSACFSLSLQTNATNMKQRMMRVCLVVALQLLLVNVQGQSDSLKVNQLNFGLNYRLHGEMVRGGLPVDPDVESEDKSNFLQGRMRLTVGYQRPGIEPQAERDNDRYYR